MVEVCPYRIRAQEFAVFCGGCIRSHWQACDTLLDSRLLHNRWTDFDALCRRLSQLDLMSASQWYKIYLCHMKTYKSAVFYGGCIGYQARYILLDGRLLHDCRMDPDALCRRLLAMSQASQ